jgi:hypothetical protein
MMKDSYFWNLCNNGKSMATVFGCRTEYCHNFVEISPESMGIWVVSFKSRVAKSLKSSRFILREQVSTPRSFRT